MKSTKYIVLIIIQKKWPLQVRQNSNQVKNKHRLSKNCGVRTHYVISQLTGMLHVYKLYEQIHKVYAHLLDTCQILQLYRNTCALTNFYTCLEILRIFLQTGFYAHTQLGFPESDLRKIMSYFISIFLKLGTYVDFVYIYIPVKFCVIHMKGN